MPRFPTWLFIVLALIIVEYAQGQTIATLTASVVDSTFGQVNSAFARLARAP